VLETAFEAADWEAVEEDNGNVLRVFEWHTVCRIKPARLSGRTRISRFWLSILLLIAVGGELEESAIVYGFASDRRRIGLKRGMHGIMCCFGGLLFVGDSALRSKDKLSYKHWCLIFQAELASKLLNVTGIVEAEIMVHPVNIEWEQVLI
jgi:hypothetical protein